MSSPQSAAEGPVEPMAAPGTPPHAARQAPDYPSSAMQPYGHVSRAVQGPGAWIQPPMGKIRSPFGVWLLALITLGIYGIVWHYKVNREVRDLHPSIQVNPALAVLALFFPVAYWCTVYNTGKRIAQAQQLWGLGNGCSGALGVVSCFFFNLHTVYYQSELNRLWRGR